MQAGRISGLHKTCPHRVPDVQDELTALGHKNINNHLEFEMPCFMPRSLEATRFHRSFQQLCDRMLKLWPPQVRVHYNHNAHVIGQLCLLVSQNRVPEPQRLIDVLNDLGKCSDHNSMPLVKCLVCHGVRISLPDEQWDNLAAGQLSGAMLVWAKVIFHPWGKEKEEEYFECCQQLIRQESYRYNYRNALPELMKYWAIQGMSSQRLMELLLAAVRRSIVRCPWVTFFSTRQSTDSFWQVWRDKYPGHFDDINMLMTIPLPDGRSFFLALWKVFLGKCALSIGHHGVLSHMVEQGVNLGAEVGPGKEFLDELVELGKIDKRDPATPCQGTELLIQRLTRESCVYQFMPMIFARLTKTMESRHRLHLLFNLLKSLVAGLNWCDFYDSSGRLYPSWHQVLPDKVKTMSDLMALGHPDGFSCFIAFWNQSRTEALRWLFELSDTLAIAHSDKDFLGLLLKHLLAEADSRGLHEVAQYLERDLLGKGIENSVLPDARRRYLFRTLLNAVKSKPGSEHTLGGALRLLRVLAGGHTKCLKELAALSEVAWQNLFGSNTPVPAHIAVVSLDHGPLFERTLSDLRSYYPEKISLFSLNGNIGYGVQTPGQIYQSRLIPSNAPCSLKPEGGMCTIPPDSVLLIDGHGDHEMVSSCPANMVAERLYKMIKPICQTLPDRIVLDSCLGARSKNPGSLSAVEQLALGWYQQTCRPVSVLGYEGIVKHGMFHPRRKVYRKVTNAYNFRGRGSRELLVTVSETGKVKKTWRSTHNKPYSKMHFPRRLNFSFSNS